MKQWNGKLPAWIRERVCQGLKGNHPVGIKKRVDFVCPVCGKVKSLIPSRLKQGQHGRLTCSTSCANKLTHRGFMSKEGNKKAQQTLNENGHHERSRLRMKNGGAAKAMMAIQLPSAFQKEVFAQVQDVYPEAKIEYYIHTEADRVKVVDICIPAKKLAIECDGYY